MNNNSNYSHQKYDFKLFEKKTFDFQLIDFDGLEDDDKSLHLILDLKNNAGLIENTVNWGGILEPEGDITTYGLTAIDNGAVPYVNDTTLTTTTLTIPQTLELNPVAGYQYSGMDAIDYTLELGVDGVINFRGGFLQGFYKLEGYKYQTLPNRYKKGWTIQTILNPDTTEIPNTLNSGYIDTDGFFFYQGTRAENKFWNTFPGLNPNLEIERETTYTGVTEEDFIIPINPPRVVVKRESNQFLIYGRSSGNTLCYREEEGFGFGTKTPYSHTQGEDLIYKSFLPLESGDPVNPFLRYGRGVGVTMCGTEKENEDGEYSANSNDKFNETYNLSDTLDVYRDIIDNAVGFRLKYVSETNDYKIGYRRILEPDCDSEENYIVKEEYTDYLIPAGADSEITIKWVAEKELECEFEDARMGKLYIYVDGFLKHVFNDFKEIINKPLYEHIGKQVGVPFNISIGGGTQGLLESMTFDGPDPLDSNLPLEQHFAGTFIGDMKGFQMYDEPLTWCEIKNGFI